MAQPSTPVWTPPSTPGNFPMRPGPAEYDATNQAIAPATPLSRIDLVPVSSSPGAYSLWLNASTGSIQLGPVSMASSNAVTTLLDSLNASPASTALAMTPAGTSGFLDIPAWTGGYVAGSSGLNNISATPGSIALTWNGPPKLGRFFFSITGTSASANQVYGFKVVTTNPTGYANGGSLQQNFTTSNAVTACMEVVKF